MKYIYSTSQMSKLSLTLHTFSITGSVAGLFLTTLMKTFITIFENSKYLSNSNWKHECYNSKLLE